MITLLADFYGFMVWALTAGAIPAYFTLAVYIPIGA
jgi:hypothetical protein